MAMYPPRRLYLAYTSTICGDEKPWMVVSTGVVTSVLYVNGRKSKLLWMTSNSPARSNTAEMCRHSATFGSTAASSSHPCATADARRAPVTESAEANSVTSTPRETSPSVSSEANCSHGP